MKTAKIIFSAFDGNWKVYINGNLNSVEHSQEQAEKEAKDVISNAIYGKPYNGLTARIQRGLVEQKIVVA